MSVAREAWYTSKSFLTFEIRKANPSKVIPEVIARKMADSATAVVTDVIPPSSPNPIPPLVIRQGSMNCSCW